MSDMSYEIKSLARVIVYQMQLITEGEMPIDKTLHHHLKFIKHNLDCLISWAEELDVKE